MSISITRTLAVLVALSTAVACGDSTDTSGNPDGDLEVELRNFTTSGAVMGELGGSTVVVAGDPTSGSPTLYSVDNPGVGSSLTFTAAWASQADTVSCSVTSATNVSVPPGVVIQAFGFLECVDW